MHCPGTSKLSVDKGSQRKLQIPGIAQGSLPKYFIFIQTGVQFSNWFKMFKHISHRHLFVSLHVKYSV